MTKKRFHEIAQEQIKRSLKVLVEKGCEYSFSEDRLDHFKDSAAEQGITPKQALWGMLSKHLTSLAGLCRTNSNSLERWTEKITDSINYLLLLRALIAEEFENEQD